MWKHGLALSVSARRSMHADPNICVFNEHCLQITSRRTCTFDHNLNQWRFLLSSIIIIFNSDRAVHKHAPFIVTFLREEYISYTIGSIHLTGTEGSLLQWQDFCPSRIRIYHFGLQWLSQWNFLVMKPHVHMPRDHEVLWIWRCKKWNSLLHRCWSLSFWTNLYKKRPSLDVANKHVCVENSEEFQHWSFLPSAMGHLYVLRQN